MSLVEFLIIYLSIGAPFGVLTFFSNGQILRIRTAGLTTSSIVFWPVILFLRIAKRFSARLIDAKADVCELPDREIDELIELINREPDRMRRELLKDYVGLSLAKSRESSATNSGYAEFLELAGNSNASVGSACLARRRERQMADRLRRIRFELIEAFRLNSVSDRFDEARVISELFRELHDHDAVSQLRIDSNPARTSSNQFEKEIAISK